jgi:dienelactone hydrolase
LEEVIFHGWPEDWVNSSPVFEEVGSIPSGAGYRIQKLRYEIIPGFYSAAILYLPEKPEGKVPAILNVNGHNQPGKALEWKQKRCINFARNGILALNLEWLYFGELRHPENSHWFGAHLDLVGANAAGLFYLAMRRGLDYLASHPLVDPERLGVTGLSGGGWQTIVLSALDERVKVAVPVAGYSSLVSRIERSSDIGDIEQNATDMLVGQDFPHLTAMRAPRPTLLIYNNDDDCCFRAPLVKPYIFEAVQPFFALMGAPEALEWHVNLDPGDHNYQLDNRIQAYRYFSRHFNLPIVEEEISVVREIKDPEDLIVGLPKQNLTVLGVARELARNAVRDNPDSSTSVELERRRLRELIRLREVDLRHLWAIDNTKEGGIESISYRLEFTDRLSATGVWMKATNASENAPVTIVLNDGGKKDASEVVSKRLNRGEEVLAVDLLFRGDASSPNPAGYTQLVATTGGRPLGIQVAHLLRLTNWVLAGSRGGQARIETRGIRSQVTGLIAAALRPDLYSQLVIEEGMGSLGYLLEAPVSYHEAPDLFCLDLFSEFDVERLVRMAEPSMITIGTLTILHLRKGK